MRRFSGHDKGHYQTKKYIVEEKATTKNTHLLEKSYSKTLTCWFR